MNSIEVQRARPGSPYTPIDEAGGMMRRASQVKDRLSRVMAGAAILGFVLTAGSSARSDESTAASRPLRVVVHVNFADDGRQGGGLKNVENILKAADAAGVGTAAGLEIEVVCHADGINLLEKSATKHAASIEALLKKGVRFAACENTMRQRSIQREDLLPGVTTVPSGAFEVVRRQHEGYSYFKP